MVLLPDPALAAKVEGEEKAKLEAKMKSMQPKDVSTPIVHAPCVCVFVCVCVCTRACVCVHAYACVHAGVCVRG